MAHVIIYQSLLLLFIPFSFRKSFNAIIVVLLNDVFVISLSRQLIMLGVSLHQALRWALRVNVRLGVSLSLTSTMTLICHLKLSDYIKMIFSTLPLVRRTSPQHYIMFWVC